MRPTLLLLLAGCQPAGLPLADGLDIGCMSEPPEPGAVRVGRWACVDQVPPGGEGGLGDTVLANAWIVAVLRQPAHALTVPGIGGGTLVDVAPWGLGDALHETIPLVDGGWLELDGYTILEDGLELDGELRPLPGGEETSGRATVTWRLDPDSPTLMLDGADGLWLHAHSGMQPSDGELTGSRQTLITDGTLAEDLGGAVILEGVTRIEVLPTALRWQDSPGAVRVTGSAPGASQLELASGGVRQQLVAIDESFEVWVPATIDAVRAIAGTRAPSEWQPPGEDLQLSLGAEGWLEVRGEPGPLALSWSAEGRSGLVVAEHGEQIEVGAGSLTVWSQGAAQVVAVPPEARVPVQIDSSSQPGPWVPVAIESSGRDASTRKSSFLTALQAHNRGEGAAVLTAANDVGDLSSVAIPQAAAVRLTTELGDVTSFPWTASRRLAAHGALDPSLIPADRVVDAMRGGPGQDRTTIADLAFVEAHGPFLVEQESPDAVLLPSPAGEPLTTWAAWLAMDPSPRPVGPETWAWTEDPRHFGILELRRALAREQTVAGTGPILELRIDGELEHSSLPKGHYVADIRWDTPLDEVWLLDGEQQVAAWDGTVPWQVQLDADRLVAVGWSSGGEWAVTTLRSRPPIED